MLLTLYFQMKSLNVTIQDVNSIEQYFRSALFNCAVQGCSNLRLCMVEIPMSDHLNESY